MDFTVMWRVKVTLLILLLVLSACAVETPVATPIEVTESTATETQVIFNTDALVADYHAFIDHEIETTTQDRASYWDYDSSSLDTFLGSMESYREDLIDFMAVPDVCLQEQLPELVSEELITTIDDINIFAWELRVCDNNLTSFALIAMPAEIDTQAPLPLVVAISGTCGSPERLMGLQGEDIHHEFGLSLARNGYIVFAPLILTRPTTSASECVVPTNQERNQIDNRMLSIGYRLLGVEIGKLVSSLDYLSQHPAINSNYMGVYGISLGGMLAFHFGAIDTRLETVVVSQYIEDREQKLVGRNSDGAYWMFETADFVLFDDYLSFYTDYDLSLLIIPRKLFIETGSEDPRAESTEAIATEMQSAYVSLGLPANYVGFEVADGQHEIFLQGSLEFLDMWMR